MHLSQAICIGVPFQCSYIYIYIYIYMYKLNMRYSQKSFNWFALKGLVDVASFWPLIVFKMILSVNWTLSISKGNGEDPNPAPTVIQLWSTMIFKIGGQPTIGSFVFFTWKTNMVGFKLKRKKDEGNMWGGFSTSMDYHKFGFGP